MSLYTDGLIAAADTQDIQAGGEGFTEKLGNALTYGTGAAVLSGLGSIYNTAAAGVNALGGSVEEIDTYSKLAEVDLNWAKYYADNKEPIDVVGFIGASLIPGTFAIKGLNAVRAGSSANAFGRALGFAKTKQAQALDRALVELGTEGGSVFTRINKNKMAAMGWGVADQTLTAAAFEVGVALTMNQSPLLADDSWWDIGKTAMMGAAFGGVLGGGIDSIILHRGFKDAVRRTDAKTRNYDYLKVYDQMGLEKGDAAYGVVDSLLRLPKEVDAMGGFVQTPGALANLGAKKFFDVGGLLSNALKGSEKTAMLDFEKSVRAIASNDEETTKALAGLILRKFSTLQAADVPVNQIRESMGDLLFELKAVKPAVDAPLKPNTDLWYFNKKLTPEERGKIQNLEDWKNAFSSKTPFANNAYGKPYIFLGSEADKANIFKDAAHLSEKSSDGFTTLKEAWAAGKHVAYQADGSVRVNPSSPLWKQIDDPVYDSRRYLNTRTGAVTDDAVLSAADRVPAGKKLETGIARDHVKLLTQEGNVVSSKTINMKVFNPAGNAEYYTARHAWAAKLTDSELPTRIQVDDFSLMDRLRTRGLDADLDRQILIVDGERLVGRLDQLSLPDVIRTAKLSAARGMLADAWGSGISLDTRELAYRLNTDAQWLETAVAANFAESLAGTAQIAGKTIDLDKGISRSLEDALTRETVLAEFARPQQFVDLDVVQTAKTWRDKRLAVLDQVARVGGQFVTGDVAWSYRVKAAMQVMQEASAASLGAARHSQLLDLTQDAAKLADSVGVGAGFLNSSNANYNEVLKLWAQNTGKLTHLWINEDLSAIVSAFSTITTRLRADATASAELGIVTNLLRSSETKYVWHPTNPQQLIDREILQSAKTSDELALALDDAVSQGGRPVIDLQSELVGDFLRTHQNINATRIGKRGVLASSRGFTSNLSPDVVYVPPIDTTYFKHFAFVRPVEGKAFGTSEVSMIFGRDAAELSKRMALIDRTNFSVYTKNETEQFFKAKELYDFNLTLNEPRINSELRKSGALNNAVPEVRAENLIEDYLRWHQNQSARLVRDSVETNYAQQIAELKKLGENYTNLATSQFSGAVKSAKSAAIDPYNDFVKTALDISKRSEYTFFHQANEFVDALGTRAYQAMESAFGDAQRGTLSWQEANVVAEKHGIKGLYSGQEDWFTANVPRDRNLAREYVAKANMLLANFVLRFDFANSLINVISTPLTMGTELASIRSLAKSDPALIGKLAELTSLGVPGQNMRVPGTTQLLGNAIKNFWGPNKQELLTRYKANGDIKNVLDQYHSMMSDLAVRPDFKLFSAKVDSAFEKAATLTGNNWSEQFTRFVSADVMRQVSDPLVEAGKMSLKEQNAYISTFVNRVQGNYITSQRPIVFQGVLGAAVGLFQTYSFNLMQQLFRHIENRDKRAIATLFGMQSGLFGLNGTPLFEAVNTHLIGNAAINESHTDAYSTLPGLVGKEMGNWLLYGTASAFPAFGDKWPALYTRGDINPRHISILPMTPSQVPAIDASIRLVKNITDVGSKLLGGADISATLLQGLEHNGINRPLAGFARVLGGQTTTSQGSLVSAASDFSLVATAARMAGSRPMDEAIALNALYRSKAYQAADRDRMEVLGEKVKTHLYNNQFPPDDTIDTFMKDYASAGGRVENFNAAMQRWSRDANVSVVEKLRGKMNSPYGRNLSTIMGGEPLEDYRNQPVTADTGALTPE